MSSAASIAVGAAIVIGVAALAGAAPPSAADAQHHQHAALPPGSIGGESVYQLESVWRSHNGRPQPLGTLAGTQHHQHAALPPGSIGEESVYQLESVWRNHNGRPQPLGTLAGKPVVAAMIYTSCDYACPLIVRDMLAIHRALDADERAATRFVLFSIDPRRDTPPAMRRYAAEQRLPAPDWTLLAADDDATLELAVALGVRYQPLAGGDFAHSNLVFVLDCGGAPAHRQEGLGIAPADALAAVRAALHNCRDA